jgi:hypothetical protein
MIPLTIMESEKENTYFKLVRKKNKSTPTCNG